MGSRHKLQVHNLIDNSGVSHTHQNSIHPTAGTDDLCEFLNLLDVFGIDRTVALIEREALSLPTVKCFLGKQLQRIVQTDGTDFVCE